MAASNFPNSDRGLPTELALEILEHLLVRDGPIELSSEDCGAFSKVLSNLLRVSRKVHEQASKIFFKHNTFIFTSNQRVADLGKIPPHFWNRVQNLRIQRLNTPPGSRANLATLLWVKSTFLPTETSAMRWVWEESTQRWRREYVASGGAQDRWTQCLVERFHVAPGSRA